MQIVSVRYARIRNLLNHENERLELSAELAPGDDVASVYRELRELARQLLYPDRAGGVE
jgi:hypothetical protein